MAKLSAEEKKALWDQANAAATEYDPDIYGADIPKRFVDEWHMCGERNAKPRQRWLARLQFEKEKKQFARQEARNQVAAKKQRQEEREAKARERAAYEATLLVLLNNYAPRQQTAAENEADRKAKWTIIGLLLLACIIGGFAVYGLAVLP